MTTDEKIESFFYALDLPFETKRPGLWVLHSEEEGVDNIIVYHDHPILTIRVKVMPVPPNGQKELFGKLLRLNATDMVHGAYAIENDAIVILHSIQTPNLDLNEIQASIDSVILAVSEHYKIYKEYASTDQAGSTD